MTEIALPASILALTIYALWALFLVLLVIGNRVFLLGSKRIEMSGITAGVEHGGPGYWRINRAHANTLENLPVFAALVFAGWVLGLDTPTFNLLAVIVVVARMVQSLVHMASGSVVAINIRFLSLLVQIGCMLWMGVIILCAARLF